jgi:hypothetical protein
MAVAPDDETTDAAAASRDLLGKACFTFHFAVMIYIVAGWAIPARAALVFYLVFLPGVALQWQFNKNACVLNNLESWLRSGRWRDPSNREEGQWLLTLVGDVTGLQFTPAQMDAFTYGVLAALWALGLWHLLGW